MRPAAYQGKPGACAGDTKIWDYAATARRSAARASSRVESSVGNGELEHIALSSVYFGRAGEIFCAKNLSRALTSGARPSGTGFALGSESQVRR